MERLPPLAFLLGYTPGDMPSPSITVEPSYLAPTVPTNRTGRAHRPGRHRSGTQPTEQTAAATTTTTSDPPSNDAAAPNFALAPVHVGAIPDMEAFRVARADAIRRAHAIKDADALRARLIARHGGGTVDRVTAFFSENVQQASVPGFVDVNHLGLIYLYWLCYAPAYEAFAETVGVPHSTLNRLLPTLIYQAAPLANSWISPGDYDLRRQVSERHHPAEFHDVTLIVDGTDIRVTLSARHQHDAFRAHYSFKFKKPAYRYQVAAMANLWIAWTSEGVPAATHDKTHLESTNFRNILDRGDKVLADSAYQGCTSSFGVQFLLPNRKARNAQMGTAQAMTANHASARARRSGRMKSIFNILTIPYRHQTTSGKGIFFTSYGENLNGPLKNTS